MKACFRNAAAPAQYPRYAQIPRVRIPSCVAYQDAPIVRLAKSRFNRTVGAARLNRGFLK